VTSPIATAAVPARQLTTPPAIKLRPAATSSAIPGAVRPQRASDDDRESQAPLFDYEDAPPWLVSLITHMALIIFLGLLLQSAPADPGFELTLNLKADPGLSEIDAGGGGAGADLIELPLAGDPELPVEAEASAVALSDPALDPLIDAQLTGLLAAAPRTESLAVDAASLLAASGGSLAGDAEGGTGTGSGDGDGAGVGSSKGDGSSPGHAVTSMFGLAGEGGDFVYVFDRSQSMNSVLTTEIDGAKSVTITPLEAAKNELNRSIGDLNDACRFQVVFYNDIAVTFGGQNVLSKATYPNKELVKSFIYGMPAESNTNHMVAFEEALQCRPQILFLLTDGEEKDDPSPSEVRRLVRECKRLKIKVNIVHFCFDVRANCSLIELARGTGGEHKFVTLRELARQKLDAMRGTPTLRAVDALTPLE
jgi:hypothetical protein